MRINLFHPQGDKFSVWTCKAKSSRNPVYKWHIGAAGAIHQFAFSPIDSNIMAVVGHVSDLLRNVVDTNLLSGRLPAPLCIPLDGAAHMDEVVLWGAAVSSVVSGRPAHSHWSFLIYS